MNHADLCSLAVKWLRRPASQDGPGCNFAASECTGSYSGEIADAIGFRSVGDEQHSVVVEAKITRNDFLADSKKPHRAGVVAGMGVFRYFLAPAGLIQLAELPPAWGLIEASPRGVLKVHLGHVLEKPQERLRWRKDYANWQHANNVERETALLVRLLARVGDVETLQRSLKTARNQVAHSQKIITRQQLELRESLKQYWDLRNEFDQLAGNTKKLAAIQRQKSPTHETAPTEAISPTSLIK